VGISFLASQLHISDLPQAVGKFIAKVQKAPTDAINAALTFLVGKATTLLGFGNRNQVPDGLAGAQETFYIGDQQHRLWTVVTSSGAQVLMASDAALLDTYATGPGLRGLIKDAEGLAVAVARLYSEKNLSGGLNRTSDFAKAQNRIVPSLGGTAQPLWKATQITQGGDGYQYAVAAKAFRTNPGTQPLFKRGASNLAAILYTSAGKKSYYPFKGNSTQVGFIPAKDEHPEQVIFGELGMRRPWGNNQATLDEIFTERYPCSAADIRCAMFMVQEIPKLFGQVTGIPLYFIVPWGPTYQQTLNKDAYLKQGYVAIGLGW
jgi:hypothetical protein